MARFPRESARRGDDAPHNLIEKLQGDGESYKSSNNNLDCAAAVSRRRLPVQQRRVMNR